MERDHGIGFGTLALPVIPPRGVAEKRSTIRRWKHQNRAAAIADDFRGHAAEEESLDPFVAVAPDRDQIGIRTLGQRQQLFRRRSTQYDFVDMERTCTSQTTSR